MDGRRLRRMLLCGGLVLVAVGCRNSGRPAGGTPPPLFGSNAGNGATAKSLWGSKPPTHDPNSFTPGMPIEVANLPTKRAGAKTLLPETEVEFANTHLEVALNDPPPPNRDELIDLARARYQRALKQDPKHKGALLGVARMYVKLGDRERAAEAYKKYQQVYPKDTEVLHELALASARWQDWAGAMTACEAALKADPENRKFRKTLGFCQARAGKWEDGFRTFCAIMPEAQARYNMARVMEHQNLAEQCRQQLLLALQMDPNYADAREMLAELDQSAAPATGVPASDPNPVRPAGFTP